MTTIKEINNKIDVLAKSERITKAVLSELSRDLLAYVLIGEGEVEATFDIQPVNRVLQVLTPINKRVAVLYFSQFMPFKMIEDKAVFGKMGKQSKVDECIVNAELALIDDGFDIWSWAANNVKVEPKEVDWNQKLTSDMTKAIEAGLTGDDILNIMHAVLEATAAEDVKQAA